MIVECRGRECTGCPACVPPPWWAAMYPEDPNPRDCVERPPWLLPEPAQPRPFDADITQYPLRRTHG